MSDYKVICDSTNRAKWLEHRRNGIGSSDAAAVLGAARGNWSSALKAYADKVLPPEPEDDDEREWMKWGRRLEPIICEAFAEEAEPKREVWRSNQLIQNLERPWQQATMDGEQRRPDRGGVGFLEVKNSWLRLDGIPRDYWIQMQHQLATSGYQWGSFAVLVAGQEFFWSDVDRDNTFIDEILIPTEAKFWQCVLDRVQPPADASEATTKALRRLFPEDDGEEISLSAECLDYDEDRQRVVSQIKELQSEKSEIDNFIRQQMGSASVGYLIDGRKYTNKANKNGSRVLRAPKEAE